MANCCQVENLMRMIKMQMSYPQDSLCNGSYVNLLLQQLFWLVLKERMLDMEFLGWGGYTWSVSAVVRLVGCTAKFSETPMEMAYGREVNIQFTGNSTGWHSCSLHANCACSFKATTSVALCCLINLRVVFLFGQPKAHLCNNHAF